VVAAAYSVELHLHTCYSFLEGASLPEELAVRAARLGYTALAITDHDGLYGAMEFAQACAAAGIRPIVGAELTLAHGFLGADTGPVHLTVLARSEQGYAHLCRLLTLAHRNTRAWEPGASHLPGADPRPAALDPADFEGLTGGLIALSGCRHGELSQLIDDERFDLAGASARALADLFGWDNTYVELQHNLVQGDTRRVSRLAELADQLGLPAVATGNVHYHQRGRHRLQDAMVAVKHRSTLENSHRVRRPNNEFFLRSPQVMAERFSAYPQAIANTQIVADRCQAFNLADHRDRGYDFPDFTRKPGEQLSSADDVLAAFCATRFDVRYPPDRTDADLRDRARLQLADELQLVGKHQLAGFFLIYRDLQEQATEVAQRVRGVGTIRGGSGLPPGRGRGSSVSSIICYLIGLSHVDPLNPGMRAPSARCKQCLPCPECERAHGLTPEAAERAKNLAPAASGSGACEPGVCDHRCPHFDPVQNRLFFRRFLNEDLQAVPDIDLDFARDIREQLILQVYERYGHEHAALVCSFATYHLRSAVRDLGKVLGLPGPAIDKLARLSEGGLASSVRRELATLPAFQGQAEGPMWAHLMDLAEQIDGFPRHVGQHVGGMIISSRPVVELVPVQPTSMPGRYICQWDKDSCDDARFIKIDFLALGMLSLVEECLELIWQCRSEKLDVSTIRYDDTAVYDAICNGDTVGLFQIESRAQIQMLTRTQPRNLDDLAVQVAIVRPGPIVGGAVNPYVRRRELLRDNPRYVVHADHPLLDEVLKDTLGIVLYQDQVLEVAIEMGGFSPGQADQFRRSMSRRRSREAMERFRKEFIEGAAKKEVSSQQAGEVFDKLCAFSEFGFPKSHAYAFAVLAYQSAWLRHYYATEYYAALLNNQPMGFYAPHVLVGDARRHGLQVLRVAINSSSERSRPISREQILLGFTSVRGIGDELATAIVAERVANGAYRSLPDVLRRTGMPRNAAEHLISVGALGEFGLGRRELLWQLGLLVPSTAVGRRRRAPSAFGGPPSPAAPHKLSDEPSRSPSHPPSREAVRKAAPVRQRQLALALPTEQDMVHLTDMTDWERMVADYGLLGLSPSYHPLAMLRRDLPADILNAEQIRASRDGIRVRAAGLVVCRQRPGTAKGFVFLLLEDETGLVNVVVRPDLYNAQRSTIRGESYLCIEGTIQLHSGTLNLIAITVTPLAQLTAASDTLARATELPRAPERNGVPGNPHDQREVASAALTLATPASRDFH
jgi:error-prone DNA polymerase